MGGRTWQHKGGFLGVRRGSSSLKVALLGVIEGGLVILKVAFLGDRRESGSRKVTFLGDGGSGQLKGNVLGVRRGILQS